MVILRDQVIALNVANPTFRSAAIPVPPLTAEITLILRRQTSALPQNWDASSSVRVTLVYTLDGVEHRCSGSATGGIRLDRGGIEMPEYRLTYRPTTFKVAGRWRRGGELAMTRTVQVLIEWLRGSIETTLSLAEVIERPAPVETP